MKTRVSLLHQLPAALTYPNTYPNRECVSNTEMNIATMILYFRLQQHGWMDLILLRNLRCIFRNNEGKKERKKKRLNLFIPPMGNLRQLKIRTVVMAIMMAITFVVIIISNSIIDYIIDIINFILRHDQL